VIARAGTKQLLELASDIKVIAEASNGREAISEYKKTLPDVVILDISMPLMDGIDACKELKMRYPKAKVLILSIHPEEQYAKRLLHAGALGYATKDTSVQELQFAVRSVADGKIYLPFESRSDLVTQIVKSREAPNPLDCLSDREIQVFQRLIKGNKLKEIAADLNLEVNTIDTYRMRILQKLGLKRTIDLVQFAYQHSLIS
jgi:DNA-binding NarL/FixJ family response regulator